MYNRRYDKKFFMLRQEQTGFSSGQKTPWGSCILEIKNSKGCLSTRVQGLKTIPNTPYEVYLIGKNEEVIFCNEIPLDNEGQGEALWEFSPDFIHSTNNSKTIAIEDISGILIISTKNGINSAPLVSYINEKVQWENFFVPVAKKDIPTKTIAKENETIDKVINKSTNDLNNNLNNDLNNKPINKLDLYNKENKTPEISTIKPISDLTLKSPSENISKTVDHIDNVDNIDTDIHVAENTTATKPKLFNFNFIPSANYSDKYEDEKEENCHGNFSALIKKFRKDLKELTEEGVFTKKDIDKIHKAGDIGKDIQNNENNENISDNTNIDLNKTENAYENTAYKLNQDKNEEKNKEKNPLEYIEQRLKRFNIDGKPSAKRFSTLFIESKKVTPFIDKNDIWNCITLDEMVLIPSFPIEWQRKFFFLYPMKQYSHFLYKEINGENYLAVPSHKKYIEDDREEATELGFSQFQPIDNSDFGYWICKKI